jgi:hypothetical protein
MTGPRKKVFRAFGFAMAIFSITGMALAADPDSRGALPETALPSHGPGVQAASPGPPVVADPDASCAGNSAAVGPLPRPIGPELMEFASSPFPYDGSVPGDNKPFLDTNAGGRRGHISPRGYLHWEDESYSDRHTLLYLPRGFDLSRPALLVVFFHGNHATLTRDVQRRQRVPAQLAASGINAVLIAPQFARDAADSSAGWFWQPGVFSRFLAESAQHLAALYGNPSLQTVFSRLPVVLVAYSGGYNPAAYALDVGGANERVRGVILLDALYGETDKFDRWLDRRGTAFFFSAYSESSQPENQALQRSLAARQIPANGPEPPLSLKQGGITFLATGRDVRHNDFMTEAWVRDPLKVALSAIEGFHLAPIKSAPIRPRPAARHFPPPHASSAPEPKQSDAARQN